MGWMYDFSRKMKNSSAGTKIFNILDDVGVRIALGTFINWRKAHYDEKHPTDQMIRSRKFFKENKSRSKRIMSLLEDEESRSVFNKMIKFRCFSEYNQLPHNSMRTQYFKNNFFVYNSKEVFVDCGAYDGDTVLAFKRQMRKTKSEYKIIAFEPNESNYKNLVRNHPDIISIQSGVWKEDGILAFEREGSGSYFLEAEKTETLKYGGGGMVEVPVRSIDNTKECIDATFIKMDIEGSEYSALIGARNIICTNKPKLAICIYHSDEDMLRLIELVHEMVPEYRLWVRQHSNSMCETVLYACVK